MNKKKIFIIAPDFYGIDKSISKAFESFGFEVFLINSRTKLNLLEKISKKMMRKFPFTRIICNNLLGFFLDKENKKYLSYVKKENPALLFIIKGETIFPRTLELIKKEIRIPLVAYIWDDPFCSYAGQFSDDYRKNNFKEGMYLYDHIFVYDPYYLEEMKKLGISNVSYLPLATDIDKYKRVNLVKDEEQMYNFDISFVGTPYPNRVKILENLTEFKLGVFGDGWERWFRKSKTPIYYKGKAVNEEVLKIYSFSKIVLNIHDPEAICGVNTRTFDILSCGAFELVDYKPELEHLFKGGEEIVYYKDIADLKRLIKYYLDNPKERNNIAEKGKTKVLNSHTWNHRIKEVIHILHSEGFVF